MHYILLLNFNRIQENESGQTCTRGKTADVNASLVKSCRTGNLPKVREIISRYYISDFPKCSYALLCEALKNNNVSIAKVLLLCGAKVNSSSESFQWDFNTPLHFGVCTKNVQVVILLLQQGAAVNAKNRMKETPLHLAIKNESERIVKVLLISRANVEAVDSHGYKPLHLSVKNSNVKITLHLLFHGALVDSVFNLMGVICFTPLHLAIERGNKPMVKLLLEYGANMNLLRYCNNEKGESPLMLAVKKGRISVVKLLLKKGAKINSKYDTNSSLLHLALQQGFEKVVQLLLKNNHKVYGRDEEGFTVLHKAVEKGERAIVKFLLKKGCSVNTAAKLGTTPLETAVEKGDEKMVRLLLTHNAVVCRKDSEGFSVIHRAAQSGNKFIVKFLLENGSNVNDTTSLAETTPLQIAVQNENEAVVNLLLKHGAKVDAKDKNGKTALCLAVEKGNIRIITCLLNYKPKTEDENIKSALRLAILGGQADVAKLLSNYGFTMRAEDVDFELFQASVIRGYTKVVKDILERDANIDRDMIIFHGAITRRLKNALGRTPLHYAYENRDLKMCKLLLSKGVKIDSKIYYDQSLLHIAVTNSDKEFVEFALEHGANVNETCKDNNTLLHIACTKGHGQIVKSLLNRNADVYIKDKEGFTPLHRCLKKDNEEIVILLLQKGSDVNAATNSGSTPMHLAVQYCGEKIVVRLVKQGADTRAKDQNNKTALHIAVSSGNILAVRVLLYSNPDLDDANNKLALCLAVIKSRFCDQTIVSTFLYRGFTIEAQDFDKFEIPNPLYSRLKEDSARGKFTRILQDLLKRKASVGALFEYQVLRACVKKGFVDILRELLRNVDVNASLDEGTSLLHEASENGHLLVARELVKFGAKINARDVYNKTPLHVGVFHDSKDVVEFLCKSKAELEARDIDGETPLHFGARGNFTSCLLLLKAGADINSISKRGFRPLHLAAEGGHGDIVKLLLDHDAEIDIENGEKETPLDLALQFEKRQVVTTLLEYGAMYNFKKNSPFLFYSKDINILLKKHMIKIQAAEMSEVNVDLWPEMNSFRMKCEEEVQWMKWEKIGFNISFYDILTQKESELNFYMRNESLRKILDVEYDGKFPIYASMLKIRVMKGKIRNRLVKLGGISLESMLEIKLPDLVIYKLFSYLSNIDLRNSIHALQTSKVATKSCQGLFDILDPEEEM